MTNRTLERVFWTIAGIGAGLLVLARISGAQPLAIMGVILIAGAVLTAVPIYIRSSATLYVRLAAVVLVILYAIWLLVPVFHNREWYPSIVAWVFPTAAIGLALVWWLSSSRLDP